MSRLRLRGRTAQVRHPSFQLHHRPTRHVRTSLRTASLVNSWHFWTASRGLRYLPQGRECRSGTELRLPPPLPRPPDYQKPPSSSFSLSASVLDGSRRLGESNLIWQAAGWHGSTVLPTGKLLPLEGRTGTNRPPAAPITEHAHPAQRPQPSRRVAVAAAAAKYELERGDVMTGSRGG